MWLNLDELQVFSVLLMKATSQTADSRIISRSRAGKPSSVAEESWPAHNCGRPGGQGLCATTDNQGFYQCEVCMDSKVSSELTPASSVARPSWVPIRSLTERHRQRIFKHILSLEESDRYLRFGYPATDEQIERYVDALDFERDEVFGIFNRRLDLIAMAHLAYLPVAAGCPATAEFGVSVVKRARSRGYGARLFEHAVLHARNRGCERLFIHALSENTAMLKIARNGGATVERDGPDSEAWLKLPPDSISSQVGELLGHQVAEFDYRLKLQAQRLNDWLKAMSEVKAHMGETGRSASE
jgi:GNAT superfamily N-acetyltransferase